MHPPSLAAVLAAGTPWGWLLVAGIGVLIGLATSMTRDDPTQSSGVGCLVTVAEGVVGAIIGVLVLGRLFDLSINDVLGVTLSAFIGATSLVMLFNGRPRRRRSEPEDSS